MDLAKISLVINGDKGCPDTEFECITKNEAYPLCIDYEFDDEVVTECSEDILKNINTKTSAEDFGHCP